MSRLRPSIIKQTIDHDLDYEEWFVRKVKGALKQADADAVIDHEDVVRVWESRRAQR